MSLLGLLENKFGIRMPEDRQKHSIFVGATKTIIPAAEIKTLVATPVELVPAPGPLRIIQFLGAILHLDVGTEVLAESADNLIIDYDDGTGITLCTIETTGFIDQAVDMVTNAIPTLNAIAAGSACINKNIAILNNSGEFTGNASNDAILTVYTAYRIVRLGKL